VLRLVRAVDDGVGRAGDIQGTPRRFSQGKENHADHAQRRQECLGNHRDHGRETDHERSDGALHEERHVAALIVVVVLLDNDDDKGDDGCNSCGNGSRYIRHDDAQATDHLGDKRGDNDDDDDDDTVTGIVRDDPYSERDLRWLAGRREF